MTMFLYDPYICRKVLDKMSKVWHSFIGYGMSLSCIIRINEQIKSIIDDFSVR
jgi:hypothetical protein